jgi:GTP cyclohydrolase I
MPDVQGSVDARQQPIQQVGVKGVRYPLRWRAADGTDQPGVGLFNLYVALPAEKKGTHMSRFIELLEHATAPKRPGFDVASMKGLHKEMLRRLEAERGRIEMSFTLFVKKAAPVSGVQSLLDYEVSVTVDGSAGDAVVTLRVQVPVKSLCPCSKSISEYGAHNQRSHVTIRVETLGDIGWTELVRFAEDSASSELWPMLKRADEKWVTERAYENPKFVEDLVRDVALRLAAEPRIGRYSVEIENFESIHNHSAFARIEHL